jgi:predicted GNAT family acetyltransferase
LVSSNNLVENSALNQLNKNLFGYFWLIKIITKSKTKTRMEGRGKIELDFPEVADNKLRNRFEVRIEEEVTFIDYKKSKRKIYLIHTQVPDGLEVRGIGTQLVKKVLRNVIDSGLQLVPWCPIVTAYIKKNLTWEKLNKEKQLL